MTWSEVLAPIKSSEYSETLWKKVNEQYKTQKCFPPKNQIFRALELTPFEDVEVVIIGQGILITTMGRQMVCAFLYPKV